MKKTAEVVIGSPEGERLEVHHPDGAVTYTDGPVRVVSKHGNPLSVTGETTWAYAAMCKGCQRTVMLTVDLPEMAESNADEVAGAIRDGYEVNRLTVEDARARPFGCKCAKNGDKP